MTMTDIHGYIQSLTPPLSRDVIYRELVQQDATITRCTVTKALRDLGYTTKRSKTATGCGICHLWVKPEDDLVEPAEPVPEKIEPKSTEQIIGEVEERNEANNALNARLLESLKVSRGLKEEIMQRQRDALVSMARQVLSLFGDAYEQQRYKP